MPRGKKTKEQPSFVSVLAETVQSENIPEELILEALKKSIENAYTSKKFDIDGVKARCEIDAQTGDIKLFHQRTVVEELEDEMDEPLDISLKEARLHNKDIQIGDIFEEQVPFSIFDRDVVQKIKTTFTQNLKEAQKTHIFDQFKELEGNIVTGRVERVEEGKFTIINLGNANGYMSYKDAIPGEKYYPNDNIKVYIKEVSKDSSRPSIISVSRSDARFLFKLFSSEILEVESGDVYIRKIARLPGVRSKIAVSSKIKGLDAAGACIGKNGTRIQKIVEQLNGGQEKIDVIEYYDDPLMMLYSAIKPAKVLGIATSVQQITAKKFNKETRRKEDVSYEGKVATIIVPNEDFSLAIGIKGQNVFLAQKLSQFDKIEIIKVDDSFNIQYTPISKIIEEYNKAHNISTQTVDTFVDDDEFEYVVDNSSTTTTVTEEVATEDATPVTEEVAPAAKKQEETYVSNYKPSIQAEHISVVEEVKPVEEEKVEVKDDTPSKKALKKQAELEAKAKQESNKKNNNFMPIYTEEELAELEAEEEEEETEIDYDEFEEYYDDEY